MRKRVTVFVLAAGVVAGAAAYVHDRSGRAAVRGLESTVELVRAEASARVEARPVADRALDGTALPGSPSAEVTARWVELLESLESTHPSHREPEALVDAPWNWGRNHPPIVFPYLRRLDPFFRRVESLLDDPRPDLSRRPGSLVLRGSRRLARLVLADAWRRLVGGKEPAGAAERIVQALEIADRLDERTLEAHRIRVDSMLRAIALVRWVVEADGADPEALRGSLDPVLAAASERTRFAEALATDLAAVASMPELRERYLAGDGIAGWLARPARAKAVRKVLEDVAAALAAVARPYPEARPVLDALERDLEEPRDWQAPGRFDPATKLREYERSIEVRVQAALGRTVLALRSYRVAQGDVPGELERLAPRFPDGLPVDARTGGPFGYEFDEDAAARLVPSPAPDLGPKGRYDRPRAWKIPFASHR